MRFFFLNLVWNIIYKCSTWDDTFGIFPFFFVLWFAFAWMHKHTHLQKDTWAQEHETIWRCFFRRRIQCTRCYSTNGFSHRLTCKTNDDLSLFNAFDGIHKFSEVNAVHIFNLHQCIFDYFYATVFLLVYFSFLHLLRCWQNTVKIMIFFLFRLLWKHQETLRTDEMI